ARLVNRLLLRAPPELIGPTKTVLCMEGLDVETGDEGSELLRVGRVKLDKQHGIFDPEYPRKHGRGIALRDRPRAGQPFLGGELTGFVDRDRSVERRVG